MKRKPKESPQSFLFRVIELRERLSVAGTEDGSEGSFKPELIQRKFFRTVSTGLSSDSIKFMLKPYLDDPAVTDEVLIEKTGEATNWEREKQQKCKAHQVAAQAARVTELQAEGKNEPEGEGHWKGELPSPSRTPNGGKTQGKTVAEGKAQVMVQELKAELAQIREMLTAAVRANASPGGKRGQSRGCPVCREAGTEQACDHCFRSGQAGHLSRGCRRSGQPQGNGVGPL